MHHAPRTPRGFSLVELMAVMAILGILLLGVVPSLNNMLPAYRLTGGARHLASTIEMAQSEAISQRKEFVLVYDLDNRKYWVKLPVSEEDEDEEEDEDADGKPHNDLEHGLPPPEPSNSEEEEQAEQEFLELNATELPEDVVFMSVELGGESYSSGIREVSFTQLGNDGLHSVGLELESDEGSSLWVKFNPMTRTIEYLDERPR